MSSNSEINMNHPYISKKKEKFIQEYGHLTEGELLLEILYAQSVQIDRLERNRSNTSKLVWWLIALPILIGFLFFCLTIIGVTI